MKYTTEELSPCKKKVNVSVEPNEINAAIDAAVALQQKGIALDGFRKGHVPAKVIEKRFQGQIYHDAAQDLVNVHINQAVAEMGITPISGVHMDGDVLIERDKELEYSFEFEHLPVFDLPDYEGLEVEQEEKTVTDDEIDAMLKRVQENKAKFVPIDGEGPAVAGQYANIDLKVIENGQVVPGASTDGYDLLIGQKTILPELEELTTTLKAGETGEKVATMPEDFMNKSLAGKEITLQVTVHAIKDKVLPPVDDALAQEYQVENVEGLRKMCVSWIQDQYTAVFRSAAQTRLVKQLLKTVDFPLPDSLVDLYMDNALSRERRRAESMGKSLSEERLAELRTKLDPEVREEVKTTVFLLAVARKEGLDVTNEEVNNVIYNEAHHNHMDASQLFEYYKQTGLIFNIRDSLLADKGMNAVYAKAKVTMVPEKKSEAPSAEAVFEKK